MTPKLLLIVTALLLLGGCVAADRLEISQQVLETCHGVLAVAKDTTKSLDRMTDPTVCYRVIARDLAARKPIQEKGR